MAALANYFPTGPRRTLRDRQEEEKRAFLLVDQAKSDGNGQRITEEVTNPELIDLAIHRWRRLRSSICIC